MRAFAASDTGWTNPRRPRLIRRFIALVSAFVATLSFVSVGFAQPVPVEYESPAKNLPAGRIGAAPFWAVLPSGRFVKPQGRSVAAGSSAIAVALSPDSRFAFVAGSTLAAIDVDSMTVVSQYGAPAAHPYTGVVAVRDPLDATRTLVIAASGGADALYFYRFDGTNLTPDRIANEGLSGFPTSLVATPDGTTAYAVQSAGNSVTAIDLRNRHSRSTRSVGFSPLGAALMLRNGQPGRLLVCNEGLMRYAPLASPAQVPMFGTPPPDMDAASSLDVVGLDASGNVSAQPGGDGPLHMDRPPDGLRVIGGAHPSAIAVSPDGSYAFVTMSNVDRIAVVSLIGIPHVVTGIDLRLFPKGPYGTQPTALAISRDGRRLYVALSGLDAIAVLDASNPLRLRRLGLIPTGDYPAGLALSDDDHSLYVVNAKGAGPEGNEVPSTLQRIDLTQQNLVRDTYTALGSTRISYTAPHNAIIAPLGSGRASARIKHVVLVLEEDKTFDSVLGDLVDSEGRPHGNGDPALTTFGATVTPNLHLLARTYALADNFYADARTMVLGHEYALGGVASDYSQMRSLEGALPREDPEDYARFGYVFNMLALHRMTYRDYGDLLLLRGYDVDMSPVDPQDRFAPTTGLGGAYTLDVPALAVLRGHVDERYPGWNLRIRDERRAREFVRDYDSLVQAHHTPQFSVVWLPDDRGGTGADIPPLREEVADGDRALGVIVSHLTRSPAWKDTAVFVMPADAGSERDHVDAQRSYALVISPYAKRGFVGHRHLSTVSVLKTEEELLGLPPLSLGDLLAGDMSDFFTDRPNFAPYTARPVETQTE
ncbi:MAG TPA: bifunctional YncE family protein/alkaline phosphatase family protein [Candidatus Acidoferrales bacterium]|nr:bifunctional YncE family protein/alkaline phosphatase family protein [Candidatus Acidoferrales bacterium]